MQKVELIVHARHVLKVNPTPVEVLDDRSVIVDKGIIIDILPTEEAKKKYGSENEQSMEEHILIPGLINTHGHTPMTLFRGFADDIPLMEWLQDNIWPAEQKWVSADFCKTGTELAIAEMIRAGTTCFTDMYFYPEDSAKVAERTGIRASIGVPVLMFPTQWASDPSEYLKKGLALVNEWKDHGLINISIAPHAPYTVTDEQIAEIKAVAEEHGALVQMHVHETQAEVDTAVKEKGQRPLDRLHKLGLLKKGFLAVHMTALTDEDIELVAKSGISVAHCPESNTKLASGFCPVHKLQEAGVNVSLGTDGAASNNDLDLFGEMRTAALLGKLEANNAAALKAGDSLRMATINGAIALGLEKVTGSLEIGKSADMCCVRVSAIEACPVYNLLSHLVYAVGRESVSDVWVAGKQLLKDRKLLTINEKEIVKKAREWAHKIKSHQDNSDKSTS